MKLAQDIINDCRESTINTNTNGISTSEFLRYLNNAQKQIQQMIFAEMPDANIFGKDKTYDVVIGQQSYDMPSDIFTESSVIGLALTNGINTYQIFDRLSNKERNMSWGYNLLGKKFLINPIPVSSLGGQLVLTYVRKLPTLDIRRAKVQSILDLVLTMTAPIGPNIDSTNVDGYCCLVDRDGVIKAEGRVITAIGASTVTLDSVTSVSVGDYLVLGKYATTNSELDDICEAGLFEYVNKRIFLRDSSKDFPASQLISKETMDSIIAVYKQSVPDNISIPITNWGYMPW